MKVAILAGGVGSRLSEETTVKPKPMVEIGGRPILWHILMHYAHYGFNDFVIGLGYKGEVIKKYFVDYCAIESNLTVKVGTGQVTIEEVMKGWQTSPGHNKNLLLPDAQEMGIALVQDPKTEFKTFWTLVIGSSL